MPNMVSNVNGKTRIMNRYCIHHMTKATGAKSDRPIRAGDSKRSHAFLYTDIKDT